MKAYDINIFKSEKLLKTAIKAKCKKWLIISTSSEYGNNKKDKKQYFSRTNQIDYQ